MSPQPGVGAGNDLRPIAPWWHTLAIVGFIGGLSLLSAREGGLVNIHLPRISERLSSYLTVLAVEWLLVFWIWIPLRQRGRTLASVVAGRWATMGAFFRDLGLGVGFFLLIAIPVSLLDDRFAHHARDAAALRMLPKTWLELLVFVALSGTAGFCEEFVFRGYLMTQFSAWTGKPAIGVVGQAVVFGLGHGYYNLPTMASVTVLGLALGFLAQWRRTLRPGILGHALTDGLGGILAFFGVR